MKPIKFFIFAIFLSVISFAQTEKYSGLSIEQLMNIDIVTASKMDEKLKDAPANIFVITKNDITNRGYTEITQIFDDLLGMDLSRSFGSDGFMNYMRGFRSYIGSNYDILIDGISFDHLWFKYDKIMAAFPLSNIEKIEIVYGPSSSIYGVRALQGVINIITEKDEDISGLKAEGFLATGFDSRTTADFNVIYCDDLRDIKISLTGRFENFDVADLIDNNKYEWTKDKYQTDEKLWGDLLSNSSYSGKFSSVTENRAIDARLSIGEFEVGYQYYRVDPGSGIIAAGDRLQSRSRFGFREESYHLKYSKELIKSKLNSHTLLRHRNSDVPMDSPFIYGQNYLIDGKEQRAVSVTLYQSLNSSVSFSQDFEYRPFNYLSLITGFFYERKNLQRDYETTSGDLVLVDEFNHLTYNYPKPVSEDYQYNNRIFQTEKGAFCQINYCFLGKFRAVGGIRYDNNSQFGDVVALRGAFISHFGNFTIKALLGEGTQAPPPRTLYGSWEHLGKNLNLKPVESKTFELNTSYITSNYMANLSAYVIKVNNAILQTEVGAENLGEKNVRGIDFNFKMFLNNLKLLDRLELWFAYGYIYAKGDETPVYKDGKIIDFICEELGDIANHKFNLGATAYLDERISLSLFGRFVGEKSTYYSNPVKTIDSYFVMDLNFIYKNIFYSGIGVALKINNLTNTEYFHSGLGAANAGDNTPGYWENGVWNGSEGYFNSLLIQPHRTITFSLLFDL